MRLYREDKGFFLIKQNLQFQNLPASQVNIEQPLDTKSFVEEQGTSEFIKVYAGNTYRTVKTDKPMELPLEEGISTTTWDFYKKNGDYFAQMSLFVSLNQNSKGLENFSEIFRGISVALEARFPSVFNNIKKTPDYYKDFLTNLLKQILSYYKLDFTKTLNITVVMNFYETQKSIKSLPDNCSIYVKDSLEKDFVFHTNQCYVVTKNELLHLKKVSKPKEGFTKSVIECKNFEALKKKLGKSTFTSGFIPNVPESRIGSDTSDNNNLRSIINFIPNNTHKTFIYNLGSHMIHVFSPLKPDETIGLTPPLKKAKEMKYETETASCTLKYFVENETLLIETSPFFLNENKEVIDFNKIKTQLVSKAENVRQQAVSTWQPLTAQAWLLLVSRLWLFQDGLEAEKFTSLDPVGPLYTCLYQASLKNINKLLKALNNTQSSADDKVEIKEEHLLEIKQQWDTAEQENKNQINWRQAFRHKNSDVAVENGGPVRVMAMQPVDHAIKLHNFLVVPFPPNIKKVLDSRSVSFDFLNVSNAIITSCKPSMIHNSVLSDTVCEFFYQKNNNFNMYTDESDRVSAKLTVVYSPIYTEHDGWAQEAEKNRELIFKALSTQIFENINIFLEYEPDYLTLIHERLGDILTQKPFNQIQASLLFCLTVKQGNSTMRFLAGIGSGVALVFPKNSSPIIEIHAMYDSNDVPVSLDSLIKPIGNESELLSMFLPSSIRIQKSLQLKVVKDPKAEILLLSGRDCTHKSLKPMESEKDSTLGFHSYTPDIKAFEKDEKGNPIVETIKALQLLRKELLEIIANPQMQSAWGKIKALLEVKNDQVPVEEEMRLVKSMTNAFKKLTNTTGLSDSLSSMFKKVGSLVTKEDEKLTVVKEAKNNRDPSNILTTKIKSVNECIYVEKFIEGCQELAESKTSLKLTSDEIAAVRDLWRIAVDEAKPFAKQVEEDDSSEILISWQNIRKKYFSYFQGVNDSMVVIAPTVTIEPPKLFEYIDGLAQQNLYSSSPSLHHQEEAKEILVFAHVLCSLQDDSTILSHIRAKFESFDTHVLGEQFCDFWRQLEQYLIYVYAPKLQVNRELHMNSLNELINALPTHKDQVSTLSSNNMLVTPLVSGVGALGFKVHTLPNTETTTNEGTSSRSSTNLIQ